MVGIYGLYENDVAQRSSNYLSCKFRQEVNNLPSRLNHQDIAITLHLEPKKFSFVIGLLLFTFILNSFVCDIYRIVQKRHDNKLL